MLAIRACLTTPFFQLLLPQDHYSGEYPRNLLSDHGYYPVQARDELAAAVYNKGCGHWPDAGGPGVPGDGCKFQVHMENHTEGWTFDWVLFAGPFGWGASTEVFVQPNYKDPLSSHPNFVPIANFGEIGFDKAAVDGHPFWSNNAVNMVCPNYLYTHDPNQELVGVSQLQGPYNGLFWTGWRKASC